MLGSLLFLNYSTANLSHDHSASDYWYTIFESVPNGSIIIGEGTNDMFIPLYIHEVQGKYQDKIVVEFSALTKPWALPYLEHQLGISLSREGVKEIYEHETEARRVAGEQLALLFRLLPDRPFYSLAPFIPQNISVVPAGPLYAIAQHNQTPFSPVVEPYFYEYAIISEEGRSIVSKSLVYRALTNIEGKEYSLAVRHAARAAQLGPLSFDAWNVLGVALYRSQHIPEAIQAWERALQLHDDERIRKNLAALGVNN